jgi:CelD/BcsL family acetyltransferase involved in cellulose biosynthesis
MSKIRNMSIERVEDAAGFEKLREDWTELLEASASNGLFLTWEWLYVWWKHLSEGRRLSIIAVRRGGQLIAIAPLVLRRGGLNDSLEFLGTGSVGSDYLDFILRRGFEEEGLRALTDYFAEKAYRFELVQTPMRSCSAGQMAQRLKQGGWRLDEKKTDNCPYIHLSGQSWWSYLATLSRSCRYNFQRSLKNLMKQHTVHFEQAGSEAQRREALRILILLHRLRWQHRGGSNAFHTPALLAFHEEWSRLALERGWLRLFVLWLDGEPAASLYGFLYHGRFYFYQSGFDPRYSRQSVGMVTMGLTIRYAMEQGAEEYDMLHGGEPYKFHWANGTRELGSLELYPPYITGWLHQEAVGMSRAVRKMAGRLLPKAVLDRISALARIKA